MRVKKYKDYSVEDLLHDQEFVSTVANRIIEISDGVAIERTMDLEDDLRQVYIAEAS